MLVRLHSGHSGKAKWVVMEKQMEDAFDHWDNPSKVFRDCEAPFRDNFREAPFRDNQRPCRTLQG